MCPGCAAAGCVVGVGVYALIAGTVAAVSTIVVVALNALSKLPVFAKNGKIQARMQAIQDCCIRFRQQIWNNIQAICEKIRKLLSPTASCCCGGNKASP